MNTLYAGIDLHSNNNVLVIVDGSNAVLYEKRLKNELAARRAGSRCDISTD